MMKLPEPVDEVPSPSYPKKLLNFLAKI